MNRNIEATIRWSILWDKIWNNLYKKLQLIECRTIYRMKYGVIYKIYK